VTDDMKKGMFVTMFYVILDSKNRVISYASAGHNPMILYRHETRETFFLNPRGFPVGISLPDESLFRRSISLEKVRLKKDDMLVIYTDGVTEAMNERRAQYGEERLIQMVRDHGSLSPEEFIDLLDSDIKSFTSGYPQSDDITVVAIKEKMTADDVLYGIRKKLIDLVEVQKLSVKEACEQMRMSPATYYRYKKRLDLMGERGLRNDVLRDDVSLKRISLEARKQIIRIVAKNPEFGAKRITEEYNAGKEPALHVTERMVYEELKRLNLNTKELRLDYLRRNRLIDAEPEEATPGAPAPRRESRDVVDDLLREIPGISLEGAADDEEAEAPGAERGESMGVAASSSSGVTEVRLSGHLDSASSAGLERRLRQLMEGGATKIVVDLTDVSYVSSGGWGIFVGEVRSLRERGGDIVLTGMSSEVYDVYELLGFADVLRAFGTVEEARAFLELPAEERASRSPAPLPGIGADEVAAAHGISLDGVGGETTRDWQSLRVEGTTVGDRGEIAVLSLRGIIDTVSAEKLRASLEQVLANDRFKIVVDMSQVEYVSSGGWGVFTERLREVRRTGGDIKLFGMDPDVYYVFTMLGFNIVLSSYDILAEAIEGFSRPAPAMGPETAEAVASTPAPPPPRTVSAPGMDIVWESARGGIRIARLAGVIETTAVSLLSDEINREIAGEPRGIVFDLTRVEYISSSGWGQFARAFDAVASVALAGMGPDLFGVYDCLEFKSFIRAFDRDAEAVEWLLGGSAAPRVTPPAPPSPSSSPPPAIDELDDVLEDRGTRPDIPRPTGVEPWEPAGDAAEGVLDEAPVREVPRGEPREASTKEIDVGAARPDHRVDSDRKLRSLGWKSYGRQLRRHAGDGDDPDSGGDGGS
jgi:anti-anti-sigma factor